MTPVEHAKHAQAQMELNSDHDNADSGHQKYPSRIRPIYHCKADRVYVSCFNVLKLSISFFYFVKIRFG